MINYFCLLHPSLEKGHDFSRYLDGAIYVLLGVR